MNQKDLIKKARAYALKNARAYKGKAQQGAVISGLFNEGLKKSEVKKFAKKISEIVNAVNSMSIEEQKKEFAKSKKDTGKRKVREGLPDLPRAKKGNVIMRFRPTPSGPLHVGHIISNMLSSLFVKKYGGKFYVIIDDTDPDTAIKEYYKEIKKDCDWIFGNVHKYINASDRIKIYYDYLKNLIIKGNAYVCACSQEEFKKLATEKKECPCRNLDLKEHKKRFEKMFNDYKPGEVVVRFKTLEKGGMKHPNPAMRDFPLARISDKPHPLQNKKYSVWPLMNLAVAVDDMEFKMTHVIRGKDHRDNAKRQEMIHKVFNKKSPWTFFIGRIKFKDLILSKRKLTVAIKEGKFSGISDERIPTIASLRKRGYKPEAFEKFAEQRGLTEVDKVISEKDFFEVINFFNK